MRVLVVEDESDVAEVIQRGLEELGLHCALAADAEAADELLARGEVDAVTLDLGMPGRGGLDWLESVATARPELARKTVVITGMELCPEKIERLTRCGAGVLAKPFTLQGLAEAVRTQLRHGASA